MCARGAEWNKIRQYKCAGAQKVTTSKVKQASVLKAFVLAHSLGDETYIEEKPS